MAVRPVGLTGWATAALAAAALRRAEARLATAAAAADATRREGDAERDRLREDLERTREALRRREAHAERLDRARRAERGFSTELREQLDRVRRGHAADHGREDVRELVLRAAIKLVEAEKGLLLSREDEDDDGDLDLVATEGFDEDPEHGSIVQRFAKRVLDRDQIVREDEPQRPQDGSTDGDDEIENLVAIPLFLRDRFDGVVICANREGGFGDVDDDLLLALGDHAGSALQTGRLRHDVHRAQRGTLQALAGAIESRHPLLAQEAGEVVVLSRRLCRRLGVSAADREAIEGAALVRDIGYLSVPDTVLLKPGPLLSQERAVVEMHPRVGHALLAKAPSLEPIAATVLAHHEHWNGDGYPHGLSGGEIPLSARVLAVVDAFVAMTHERPFRAAWPRRSALDEIVVSAGREFDPEIAAAFVEEFSDDPDDLEPELATAVEAALDGGGPAAMADAVAATDPLTLLPGHRAFREDLEAAVRAARETEAQVVVAVVRLDTLGAVNRQAGYAAGDEAIVAVSRAVQRAATRCGAGAYRESGRRFCVLLAAEADLELRDPLPDLRLELADADGLSLAAESLAAGEPADDLMRRVLTRLASS